jgi:hypothetical protein
VTTRLAFAAEFWGDKAVICRVIEGRAGLVVDPQFGLFSTWTEANEFARRLNDKLGLTASDSHQIVTDAILGWAEVGCQFNAVGGLYCFAQFIN